MADDVKPASTPKRILIVDDDPKIRGLLREILNIPSYQVLEAENGKQALEMIHKEAIDLVITDRDMPRMGGFELLTQLQEEKRSIPAVMISAYGDENMWAKAVGLGAEDYILKPFSTESVMKIVKKKLA